LGYRVVGIIATENAEKHREEAEENFFFINSVSSVAENFSDVKMVGGLEDLPEVIRALEIQEVIITDSNLPSEKLFEAMMSIGRKQKVEFRLAPSVFNFLPQKTSVEQIGVLPMVRLFREPLSDAERFIKRVFDILIAAVLIIALSPLWLLIALFIKLDSKGAILFRQERVGMDGRRFLCYKFRTMRATPMKSCTAKRIGKISKARAKPTPGMTKNRFSAKSKTTRE
jgi:hypothetical protein